MDRLPGPANWHLEHVSENLILASKLHQVLFTGQTKYQQVAIIETESFGKALVLDGKTQSSEVDEFVYHEGLVHPALTAHSDPRTVFIAGGGEGATAREVLKHRSVEQVVMVDLDKEVVDLCIHYLPGHHAGAYDDPRIQLHHADALEYLQHTRQQFDVIIIDIPDPLEGGPAYLLYTSEFYSLVHARLKPGGLMVAQAGPAGPTNHREVFTAIHHTVLSRFRWAYPYRLHVPSFGTLWGFVIGAKDDHSAVANMLPEDTDRRLGERISSSLRFYDGITHAGLFALPKYLRQALTAEQRLITRDSPIYAV